MIKNCVICEKEFDTKGNTITCSVLCRKQNRKNWIQNNAAKIKAYQKQYAKNHPEKYERWRLEHPKEFREIHRKSNKQWVENNREKFNKLKAKWRQNNPEKVIANVKRWQNNNPEKKKAIARAYYQRFKNAGKFDKDAWKRKLKRLGYKCVACGSTKNICKDHIIPLSKGGTNHIRNLQPFCRSCNAKKHTKTKRYRIKS